MSLRRAVLFAAVKVCSGEGKWNLAVEPVPILTSSVLTLRLQDKRPGGGRERGRERAQDSGFLAVGAASRLAPAMDTPMDQPVESDLSGFITSFTFNSSRPFPTVHVLKIVLLIRAWEYCHFN